MCSAAAIVENILPYDLTQCFASLFVLAWIVVVSLDRQHALRQHALRYNLDLHTHIYLSMYIRSTHTYISIYLYIYVYI